MENKAPNTATTDMQMEQLKKRDYILLVDMSGSMGTKDCPGGKSRWEWAKEETLALAQKCAEFDDNGITIGLFNGKWSIKENVPGSEDAINELFSKNEPHGSTNTAGVLNEILTTYLNSRTTAGTKPITVICVTDGSPDSKDDLKKTIINAANTIEDDSEIGISFVQVGKDGGARIFLKELDDDLQNEGAKFDIVDTVNDEEMQDKTLTDILIAAVCD